MKSLTFTKDSFFLFITKETGEQVRYNLKTKSLERLMYGIEWRPTQKLYKFFYGYHVSHITADAKFIKMLNLCKEINYNCKSLSTFIDRLQEYFIYEPFLADGIKISIHSYHNRRHRKSNAFHFTHSYNEWNKIYLKLIKEHDLSISKDAEKNYFDNKVFIDKYCDCLNTIEMPNAAKRDLTDTYTIGNNRIKFLVEEYNYDLKSLLSYLGNYLNIFEGLKPYEGVTLLRDYYSMANKMSRKVKKYPKYLKSMHDIIMANYQAYKEEYDEIAFSKLIKPELEFKNKDFCILNPQKSKDIIGEGTSLNHCVSSYISRILEKQTWIVFLRYNVKPDESLVTIEIVKNNIIQAKGAYNRKLTEPEQKFLELFAKEKELTIQI